MKEWKWTNQYGDELTLRHDDDAEWRLKHSDHSEDWHLVRYVGNGILIGSVVLSMFELAWVAMTLADSGEIYRLYTP